MNTDFLVIGSGIAGLNFALHAAKKGEVILVTKKNLVDSNTNYAQGGIAAVLDKTDNYKKHIKDTLEAGCKINNKKAVEFMVKNAPKAIYRLVDLGVKFEKNKNNLKLTKEGGHSHNRIAYVGDYTGKEIENILVKRIKEHPNIKILENSFALDLIIHKKNCYGTYIIQKNKISSIQASQTILATGGGGQIFSNTTNPAIATADGIAMALRSKVETQDLEFIQFHPTAFAKKITPRFLISEALRGEGAKIINTKGERFMKEKELAPRDIVSREIFQELKNGAVYLDISHKKRTELKKRFPQIFKKLLKNKIDISKDKIPINPAVHYFCGGIKIDLQGKTNIKSLFAFGEVSCSGVHGANRLASNSLLEALVFSNQILSSLKKEKRKNINIKGKTLKFSKNTKISKKIRKEIQEIMWQYAGIIRSSKEIKKIAIPQIKKLKKDIDSLNIINQHIAESQNIAKVALAILKSILKRKKSIGCHYITT